MRIQSLITFLIAVVVGFTLAMTLRRPAKVKAAGIVHVDEVRFLGALGGNVSPLGNQVVGFSCTQYENDQKIHCFVASQ
jgi:hypothetical protein